MTMKKRTNWDRYFKEQMADPGVRSMVKEEIKALRIGVQLAKLRQRKRLSQTQLAAKAGMSGPNISRIEASPGQNLTLGTLVKLARALDYDVAITFQPQRAPTRAGKAPKGLRSGSSTGAPAARSRGTRTA